MRVLVACEESQVVAKAFRARGHEAFSCDIQDCSGGCPEWHIRCDVREVLDEKWDMIIAHPPCDHLAVSGARWFEEKKKDGRQQAAIEFFMLFANHSCQQVAIENPVSIMSTTWRKPDQIIHPYMFGHPEQKATCLWLKGLPLLVETERVYDEMIRLPKKEREKIHFMPPSPERSKLRSRTFEGIAKAMAMTDSFRKVTAAKVSPPLSVDARYRSRSVIAPDKP